MPVNLTVSLNYVIVLQINKLINVIWMKFKLCMVKIKVYFKSTRTPKIKPEPAEWHSRTRVNALEGDTEVEEFCKKGGKWNTHVFVCINR